MIEYIYKFLIQFECTGIICPLCSAGALCYMIMMHNRIYKVETEVKFIKNDLHRIRDNLCKINKNFAAVLANFSKVTSK